MGYTSCFLTHLRPDNLMNALKKHIEAVEYQQGGGLELVLRESKKDYKIDFELVHYMKNI
jgi:hypothetical protein